MANRVTDERTQWTLIRKAQGEGPAARQALGELFRRYQRSIVALIEHYDRRRLKSPEETKQEFVRWFLEREDIFKLDPEKGKFRAWLAVAVRRHVLKEAAHYATQKNPERFTEHGDSFALAETETAEHILLRRLTIDTLRHAQERLRETTRNRRFEQLLPFLPGPDMDLGQAAATARRLGMKPGAFRKTLCELREEFEGCLRRAVADTLHVDPEDPSSKAQIDRELRELYTALRCVEITTVFD